MSCHVISSHLISSHLISSHLISSHLISSHLISSHLISSHLISSHLISSHFISWRLISFHVIVSCLFCEASQQLGVIWANFYPSVMHIEFAIVISLRLKELILSNKRKFAWCRVSLAFTSRYSRKKGKSSETVIVGIDSV